MYYIYAMRNATVKKIKGRYCAILRNKECLEIKNKTIPKEGESIKGKVVIVNREFYADLTVYHKKIRLFKIIN